MKTLQQNMTCTRFLSFILLHIFLFTLTNAQLPFYKLSYCQNSTEKTNNTAYQSNINKVLSWIDSDSAAGTVSNQTTIHSSSNNNDDDDVYGFYDCRGDVRGTFCKFCVNTAVKDISQRCPSSVSAIIWYDLCIVGFSNHNIPGKVYTTPTWNFTGTKTVKDSTELGKTENDMRSLIGKVTSEEANVNWAKGEFDLSDNEKRYGWVQCSRDISKDGCRQCLEAVLDIVPHCCGTKVKWAVLSPSCGMEIDDNKFYNLQTGSPSSLSPNPGKKKGGSNIKTLMIIIILSVLVAVALLVYCVYYYRRKKGELLMSRTISFRDRVHSEDSLNGDLPIIPLTLIQQSTDNFSESSKLGEGGFGQVYKGVLPDGTEIAAKRLSETSGQGSEEFRNEVTFIAKLQHRNLVKLLGFCFEENENILVYEYMPNSSLNFHLFRKT
ncbi:hypothetical protein KIW84_044750 [Lathyrus oleraceus]|uniref:non-specific serine/threonine protein kinase n=1 Tax=Pisum sativum TaxID=3888 RepID=A0A9D5AVS2_PEA|nr:hypothetical protein KIW84_044750 [Pisum sativum]